MARAAKAISLDAPRGRSGMLGRSNPQPSRDRFGRFSEAFARGMGTSGFLIGMTIFVTVWLLWNSLAPVGLQFDPRSTNFTLLTLILSLQASYAAPLILLAQNRQDDRDRVQIEQDRQRAERNLADTEYLAREIVALRMSLTDISSVVTKDVLKHELRALLEQLDARDGRDGSARPEDLVTDAAASVLRAVSAVTDPELRRPIGDLDMVRDVTVDDHGTAHVAIALTIIGCPAATRIETDVRAAAASVPAVAAVELSVGVMSPDERRALTEKLRGGRGPREMPFGPDSLTRVIAVTSGKGGVGKSTVTANLSVALAARGLRVGLVDADVHGFSIPALMGLIDADGLAPQPTRINDLMLPPVAHGVKVISIGMFLRRGDADGPVGAVAWRGPMLHRTVLQFLTDVYFGDLDVLVLDMPPGTGDIAISVGQLLPHAEVLVVTTPQPAAADVAIRSALVARQTGQRVIGVVENMAPLVLPDGTTLDLFGSGGGAAVAAALSSTGDEVPVLGSIPLSPALRESGDAGVPVVVADPDDSAAVALEELAASIASRPRGLAGRSLPFTPN